jgi:stage III sporulation protein SpoIIIAA
MLSKLNAEYQDRPWPVERKKLPQPHVARALWNLAELRCLQVRNTNVLIWNMARVKEQLAVLKPMKAPVGMPVGQPMPFIVAPMETAPSDGGSAKSSLACRGRRVVVVDTLEELADAVTDIGGADVVGVDTEGVPERLSLIQISTGQRTWVLDCHVLGARVVTEQLAGVLCSEQPLKIFHDLHQDASALRRVGGLDVPLQGVLDLQLLCEALTGNRHMGMNAALEHLECPQHPGKEFAKKRMSSDVGMWERRPLRADDVDYAAADAFLLCDAYQAALNAMEHGEIQRSQLIMASQARAASAAANEGRRAVAFDKTCDDFLIASAELLMHLRPEGMLSLEAPRLCFEWHKVVGLLPKQVATQLATPYREGAPLVESVSDLVLDRDRRPYVWTTDQERVWLGDEKASVTLNDVTEIERSIGGFGSDNRAGLSGELHRISRILDRSGTETTGLTLRMGRSVKGVAETLTDVLLGTDKSVLLLGEPGSGKTTLLRDAARLMAETANVIVVDTSCEVAGDGALPHECIGHARRVQVPSLDAQASTMVEVLQNHTPHCMVIDEIGRPREVSAAKTTKERGVRVVASAHGDLRTLLKNGELNRLIGGVESVVIGDEQAKHEAAASGRAFSKTKTQRQTAPTFDVVVQVRRGAPGEFVIIHDVAQAVDRVLQGSHINTETRTRTEDGVFARLGRG